MISEGPLGPTVLGLSPIWFSKHLCEEGRTPSFVFTEKETVERGAMA